MHISECVDCRYVYICVYESTKWWCGVLVLLEKGGKGVGE
jgi:hypothetical protein